MKAVRVSALNRLELKTSCPPSSYLVMPGWWAQAYETAEVRQRQDALVLLPDVSRTVAPFARPQVLRYVSLLVDACQQALQALSSDASQQIILRWSDCLRSFGVNEVADRAHLLEAFEGLSGLRILNPRDGQVLSVFGDDACLASETDDVVFRADLKPWTAELLLGLSDGHKDAARVLSDATSVGFVLGQKPPLCLSRPLWLDLSASEQLLYCRLEKAMQWDVSLLHLEGVYGVGLAGLFDQYDDAIDDGGSLLMQRLRRLGRLGLKMVEHGIMVREPESSFYASARQKGDQGPTIIWQASTETERSEEERCFFASAFESLRKLEGITPLLPIWQRVAPNISRSGLDLKQIYARISEIPGGVFRVSPTSFVQAHHLFFEWSLRNTKFASPIALSVDTRSQQPFSLCHLDGDVVQNFTRFLDLAANSDMITKLLANDPEISLGQMIFSPERNLLRALLDAPRYEILLENDQKAIAPAAAPPYSEATKVSDLVKLKAQNSSTRLLSLAESKMIRIAHDELEKMWKTDQRAYETLKDRYLKSLEENQRSLMLDFQRRMKPTVFEEQIKQRLVRFMVSHPSEWKSSRSSLQ